MSENAQIAEISAWFRERGYEIVVHRVADGFFAPYMPVGKEGGVARFTWGATALDAAQAAQAELEAA
jgi:hypothetical protein